MSEIKRGRGYVYAIQYHIVWCVKYRHKILVEEIDVRLKEILVQIASDNNFTISEIESDSDHIHLLVELWGGNFWNPSYFVATVSEHTEQQIRTYIQNQKVK